VALKVLDPAIAADARFRERFLRESRVAALLEHPNIVPVLDAGEDGGLLYIAMEWVDGVDLRTLLRRDGPLEPARAVALVAHDATGRIDGTDDSGPTITLLALMALALGLAGVGFASWLAVSRKRGRATV
jgi:serine/threonine protein kinase